MTETTPTADRDWLTRLYDLATDDEDASVCRDIPEAACVEQPRNFFAHVVALVATKAGDILVNAKTVLAWTMDALGAPTWMTAWLVPVRESLALLPQLVVAGVLRRRPVRKWFWVAGSLVQGGAVLALVPIVLGLSGMAAGAALLAALGVFSLARSVCSVTIKDVQGKTVSKTRRGRMSGYAASAAGGLALVAGVYLHVFEAAGDEASRELLATLFVLAGAAWLFAAAVYAGVREPAGSTGGGRNALAVAYGSLHHLRSDPALRRFLLTRALLTSSALAAPFFVLVAREQSGEAVGLGLLGLMVIANGAASLATSSVWGALADRSSRRVLMSSGALAAISSLGAVAGAAAGIGVAWFWALLFFALAVAHSGVRIGRKTYLVDLATGDTRAGYVALANTLIGVVLVVAGGAVAALSAAGPPVVLGVLALASLSAVALAATLPEVEA